MTKKLAKILVVEDDSVTSLALTSVLIRSGYEVVAAPDGRIGLSTYMKHRPDLVLTDLLMPNMDGFDLTKAIRSYDDNSLIPILVLTGLEDISSIDQAFEAGATDFITKPLNWSLLTQRIKYALKTSKLEIALLRSQSQNLYAQKLAKLGYWEWDAQKDLIEGADNVFEMFGVRNNGYMNLQQFTSHVVLENLAKVHSAIHQANKGQSNISLKLTVKLPSGKRNHIECLADVQFDSKGHVQKIVGSAQDISRLHQAEEKIAYVQKYDRLTHLVNRNTFNDILNTHLKTHQNDTKSALLVVDIDHFKKINNHLGQEKGDQLLKSVAEHLQSLVNEQDTVARLGSDEFAVLLQSTDEPTETTQDFFKSMSTHYYIDEQEVSIHFSVGVSFPGQNADKDKQLLAQAITAKENAKQAGGDQLTYYRPDMNTNITSQVVLENDLRKALAKGEIEVYYQPQVHTNGSKPSGAEALVRWKHPTEGMISPVIFIPMAETSGIINDIGHYVLKTAIQDTEHWHQQGFTDLHIGINLSARQFVNVTLMEDIQEILSNVDLPPKFIDLEITESLAMTNVDHNIKVLRGLKAMGLSLSIDDFGTGYSSLAYLHSFPVDTIKIDRSFIINLENESGKGIVHAILAMAKSLSLKVVAEGIETKDQQTFLQQADCDICQGYKFGKPMPKAEFETYLKRNVTTPHSL